MPTISLSRTTTKSAEALWKVLDDFGNIAAWNSGVRSSVATSEQATGLGATRHCDLAPLGKLEEEVVGYEPGRRMTVLIHSAKGLPLKTATADFTIVDGPDGATIALDYEFSPKGGPLGRAATGPMTKALTRGFTAFLQDWAAAA